ncbi:penicillin-binding protein 1A [Siculibacillus lacustris]|uniref:Penicillin-binding protein 1A n=1 Tax=Siculibacillus lacustris TaxID=1549641 RepID=A0A4Q9VYF0_9HYPH|nr:penicillin-binding protein 1A [Siculibacillus lacustris]
MLIVDAWVDTTVYRAFVGSVERYRRLSLAMRAFRLRGISRFAVEILDDAVTFGAAGAVLALALAVPAFEVTRHDWRKNADYAVNFLDRYGNEIGRRGIVLNDTVPLEAFPDHLIKALLATEDRRFFEHFGIDVIGTARAVVANLRHKTVVQGGSSLTQQLAKNLFLTNERSIERKIKEAFLAMWIETHMTKREILKLYLDRAYMGGGNFGVAAASDFYFGKSVRDIDLSEAAMLAGLFKAPTKYAPHANLPAARARANDVLSNMVAAGFLTEGQVIGARRRPAKPIDRARTYSPDYFLDYAFDQLEEMAPADHTLTVRTTIDIGIQKKAEEAIENQLRQRGEELDISQAAAVVLEPNGAVRAMVGGRDYSTSQFNRATDAARQPGSSFKPYVYTAALLAGKTPTSVVTDQPVCIGNWCPKNYGGGYYGRVTLLEAIARSLNSIPVQLAQQIGRERVAAVARMFGIDLPVKPDWPFVIGSVEVHMIDHAAGYAVFASGGLKVTPFAIEQIATSKGEVLWERSKNLPPPERIFPADKMTEITSMLYNAVETGTGRNAKLDGVPAGGKTGTTSDSRDAWFCGFTGNYVGVVWVGNDDYRPMERVTGGMVPAPIWHDIMTYAHQNIDLKQASGMPPPKRGAPAVAAGDRPPSGGLADVAAAAGAQRPKPLSAKAIGALTDLEGRLKAAPSLPAPAAPTAPALRTGLVPLGGEGGGLTRLAAHGDGLTAIGGAAR